jgi:hypothetical protein
MFLFGVICEMDKPILYHRWFEGNVGNSCLYLEIMAKLQKIIFCCSDVSFQPHPRSGWASPDIHNWIRLDYTTVSIFIVHLLLRDYRKLVEIGILFMWKLLKLICFNRCCISCKDSIIIDQIVTLSSWLKLFVCLFHFTLYLVIF